MGLQVEMIDAKSSRVNTKNTRNDFDFGDAVLERCISYFRGLHYTAYLEFLGIPVINKLAVASVCGNKMMMSLKLAEHKIPAPQTFFAFTREDFASIISTCRPILDASLDSNFSSVRKRSKTMLILGITRPSLRLCSPLF